MFFKKKKNQIDFEHLPLHLAFICDGNRRWARNRGLPTLLGHKEGLEAVKRVVKRGAELGIKNMTFFCFSTENFDRSKEEIDYLFDLFRGVRELKPKLIELGYKLHHTGDKSMLPDDVNAIMDELEKDTAAGEKGTVNLAIAYGGRNDIVNAAKRIVKEKVKPEDITEASFKNYLTTGDMPDVDLLVRTSGEQRISGYLLYNMAYAELYFVQKHWPSFKAEDVDDCVIEFQKRHRRFGK
ncbi:MAG: di-trans,poly-cis-decaprenylcistransferase [Clostridia bacterium]|nr:di-trans,poly-cis-decaprenylcistransferase [Clostridia bacterium]